VEDARLGVGDESPVLEAVKRKLGLDPLDGVFTAELAQRVRGLQLLHGMETNGLIDQEFLSLLGLEAEGI
jgi:murein L,D-transpeptidase YcbB/YkuD